jgi:hypothetical protein
VLVGIVRNGGSVVSQPWLYYTVLKNWRRLKNGEEWNSFQSTRHLYVKRMPEPHLLNVCWKDTAY